MDALNLYSVGSGSSTSRKYNSALFPFPINGWIEFKWSSGTISTSTRRRMASTKISVMPCPSYIGVGDTSEKIQKICSPYITIAFKTSSNLCKSHLIEKPHSPLLKKLCAFHAMQLWLGIQEKDQLPPKCKVERKILKSVMADHESREKEW